MKECLKIEIFEGHILLLIDGKRLLIDTGSPQTIYDQSSMSFADITHNDISTKIMNAFSIDDINRLLGTKLNGLIGCDVLSKYIIKINPFEKSICFITDENEIEDKEGFKSFNTVLGGIPIIESEINNSDYMLLLDSGAKLSYINPKITERFESLGLETDFHPHIGNFQTETYSLSTNIYNHKIEVLYGNLPEIFQTQINMINVQGVIGSDLFLNKEIIIDFINNRIKIKNNKNLN